MGIKRIVDVSFWTDDKVVDMFSAEDKYFMLYLLTNPHTTQLGIYQINKKIMAFETGYSTEAVTVLIDRFQTKYGMIRYSESTKEVAIKNFLKHSIIKGGQPVEDLLKKEIASVKDKSLLRYIYKSISSDANLNKTVCNITKLLNVNDNVNDNDNDNEESYHDSHHDSYHDSSEEHRVEKPSYSSQISEIISFLNETAGTSFKDSTPKTRELITARIKQGFTVDNFKTVINKKYTEWKGTDFAKFLRPETLFGNKFEGYLNEKGKEETKKESSFDTDEFFNAALKRSAERTKIN